MERESGLSGIFIGLILAMVVILVAIVLVIFMFPQSADVAPVFRANIERSGDVIYLYHDGGDPLAEKRTAIRIDGQEVAAARVTFLHGQDWPWSTGETIRVQSPSSPPGLVEVLYLGDKGKVVVFSSSPGTTVPATTPSSTPLVTGTPQVTGTTTTPISVFPVTSAGTQAPATGQPPVAAFSVSPVQGEVPLSVRFTDLSTGNPTAWSWSFGDGGTAKDENPVHRYEEPGVYTVSLTVENQYGTSVKTEADRVVAGMLPTARFSGTPTEGLAPLTVRFEDLSTGSPTAFSWDFGDGSGSTEKNPVHVYTRAGEFTVGLVATNRYGSDTRIQNAYIMVTQPQVTDIYLTGSQAAYLVPEGYFRFVVNGPGATMKIGGTEYRFAPGDLVQLFPGDFSSGGIDLNGNGLTQFSFSDVRMYVNGELKRTGIVSATNVPQLSGIESTFAIVVPAGQTGTVLFAGETKVANPEYKEIVISNLCPDSSGSMYLNKKTLVLDYRGGATGYMVG